MNHPQLQGDGAESSPPNQRDYQSMEECTPSGVMEVEGAAALMSLSSGHYVGETGNVSGDLIMTQISYNANPSSPLNEPLPPISTFGGVGGDYAYIHPTEHMNSVGTVNGTPPVGAAQTPYYHPQIPDYQQNMEVVRNQTPVHSYGSSEANSQPMQMGGVPGDRNNIYNLGQEAAARAAYINSARPTGRGGAAIQSQQQGVRGRHTHESVAALFRSMVDSGVRMSQSQSPQIPHPQTSVIRHTEEFVQEPPLLLPSPVVSPSPAGRGRKSDSISAVGGVRSNRMLRVPTPQRRQDRNIIQLQNDHNPRQVNPRSPGVPNLCLRVPGGVSVTYPQYPHPPVRQQEIIPSLRGRGRGLLYSRPEGASRSGIIVDIDDRDGNGNADNSASNFGEGLVLTLGGPVVPRGEGNLSPSLRISHSMVPIVPPEQIEGLNEQWSKTNAREQHGPVFHTSTSETIQHVASTAMTPQGPEIKTKRKTYTRKNPKPKLSHLHEGGIDIAEIVGTVIGEAAVKPKKKPTPRKPNPPSVGQLAGVAELTVNAVSNSGEVTAKPNRNPISWKKKQPMSLSSGGGTGTIANVAENNTSKTDPVKPKKTNSRKPKSLPQTAPISDLPSMPGISSAIDSSHSNFQAQFSEILQTVNRDDRYSNPAIGTNTHAPTSPKRGRGRGARGRGARGRGGRGRGCSSIASSNQKIKIEGTRVYSHVTPPSPDITDSVSARCNATIHDEGKIITTECIESGMMVKDGLRIRGNDGENLVILDFDANPHENPPLMDSSSEVMETTSGGDYEKTSNAVLPFAHQTQNILHGGIKTGESEVLPTNSKVRPSTSMKAETFVNNEQLNDAEGAGNPKNDDVLDMEVDQQTPLPALRGKRQQSKESESPVTEDDSDSTPYSTKLKRKKRGERLNSQGKSRSSVSGTGSEDDEGKSKRTTRSTARTKSSSHKSQQSGQNREMGDDRSSPKGKRKLEYDSISVSDVQSTDESLNDEMATIRISTDKNNSNERSSETKFGRGRGRGGRGRGRPPFVKNRMTAKKIARNMTHTKIVSSMDHATLKTLQIQNNKKGIHKGKEMDDEDDDELSHHSVMENVGNLEVQTELDQKSTRKSEFAPHFIRPAYTEEERNMLYEDQRFVVDLHDFDKEPDSMFIWQINEDRRYLRQYYPSKFAGRQFHSSSSIFWYFSEEDFKSDAFYARFQPIVVIIASTKVCFKKTDYREEMVERIVQFVYIDKIFFARMAKNLGRIHGSENLRRAFMDSLPVYTMTAMVPQFLRVVTQSRNDECYKKFVSYIIAWEVISDYFKTGIEAAYKNSDMTQETFEYLKHFPDLSYSVKNVNKRKTCSACPQKGRTPVVKVNFGLNDLHPKPYDLETLEELSSSEYILTLPNETLLWCKACSRAAKKFHRFYHFRYTLLRIVKQNMAKDVAMFRRCNAKVTDAMLIWIMKTERSWQNAMFLDFQVCAAEMEAEFSPNVCGEIKPEFSDDAPVEVKPEVSTNAPVGIEPEVVSNSTVTVNLESECTDEMNQFIDDLIN